MCVRQLPSPSQVKRLGAAVGLLCARDDAAFDGPYRAGDRTQWVGEDGGAAERVAFEQGGSAGGIRDGEGQTGGVVVDTWLLRPRRQFAVAMAPARSWVNLRVPPSGPVMAVGLPRSSYAQCQVVPS